MNLKPRTPKPRKSRAERAQDLLRWGPEPEFSRLVELTPAQRHEFYTWHHYVSDRSEGLEWLYTYLSDVDPAFCERVKTIKERRIADSFFWKARMLLLGYRVPDSTREMLRSGLEQLLKKSDSESDVEYEIDPETGEIIGVKESDKPVPESKKKDTKVRDLTLDTIEAAEDCFDADSKWTPYEDLKDNIPKGSLKAVRDEVNRRLANAQAHFASYDSETRHYLNDFGLDAATKAHDKKAYADDKAALGQYIKILGMIVEDADRILTNTKAVRKPRKKKVLSVDKRVSRVKYQKEDTELKLVSIPPAKILGAQELWTYNTKYNFLSVYRASGEAGLDVKGTTLLDYDEKASYFKKLGRRPAEHLANIIGTTKGRLKKTMDEIKADAQSVNGRINENTILLRVV